MTKDTPDWQALARSFRTLGQILGSIVMGGLLGWLADRKWQSLAPWGLLAGLVIGLALAVWQSVRSTKE